uniref:Uncharacterized protein n=1 Tax=Anguilla anguilla TaxID=7936 RepID=A0A0E9UNF7_ANGAN
MIKITHSVSHLRKAIIGLLPIYMIWTAVFYGAISMCDKIKTVRTGSFSLC